jgi:nicotinamidase/pyrazinamidase
MSAWRKIMTRRALILVDIQNDFCAGGALAVPDGDAVVSVANRLIAEFAASDDLIVATQDAHPANHGSFASQHSGAQIGDIVRLGDLDQIAWPDHCIEGTTGAELHPDLAQTYILRIFKKGTDPTVDSYSAFFDNGRRVSTGLGEFLKEQSVEEVWLCGLATDYCVKATALDAASIGFAVTIITDACRAVEASPGDGVAALNEMAQAGCMIV